MNSKSDEFKKALQQIFESKGPEVLKNPRQIQAMLKDLAPKRDQETKWLMFALGENVGGKPLNLELLKASSLGPEEQRRCIERCEQHLQGCMSEAVSHFVIHAAASALNFEGADAKAESPAQNNGAVPPPQSRRKDKAPVQQKQSHSESERRTEERVVSERETAILREDTAPLKTPVPEPIPPSPHKEPLERTGPQKKQGLELMAIIALCICVAALGAFFLRQRDTQALPLPPVVAAGTDEEENPIDEAGDVAGLAVVPVLPADGEESNEQEGRGEPAIPAKPDNASFPFDDLTGTWLIRGAYFVIFEKDSRYYFNFVVSNGLHNHLEFPVPLSEENGEAVAVYDDDGCGNGGVVRISQEDDVFYMTATVDDRYLPQYDSHNNLSALIVDHESMEYDKGILKYPIYMDYLDPSGFDDAVDLNFLKNKEYHKVADSRIVLQFTVLDPQSSIKFLFLDYDGDTVYEGTATLTETHKDYVVLSGHDDEDPKISLELECHYDNTCHLYTSDGKNEGTAFKKS